MKNIIIAVVILAVAAASYAAYVATRPAAMLEVIHPRRGTIRAYVEEQAVTQLPTDYLIATPIAGWLEPITLREGDKVSQGQTAAKLDTEDLTDRVEQARQRIAKLETKIRETDDHRLEENALTETEATVQAIKQTVAAAEAKLLATKAVLDFAESEVDRLKSLSEMNAAAQNELNAAITHYKQSDAQYRSDQLEVAALRTIEAVSYVGPKFIRDYIDRKSFTHDSYARELEEAKLDLQIAQRNLDRAEIKSPVDGVVLDRFQTRRQYLPAGTPLLTIGQLDQLEVVAEVLTEQATQLSKGDPVEIYGRALNGETIPGRVERIYPAGFTKVSSLGVEQQRVNIVVSLDQRPEYLGVGFRVYVRMFHSQADDALSVPRTALIRDKAGNWQVIAVRDGRTRFQTVKIGLLNDDEAQVLEGLAADDLVVLRPARDIESGVRVDTQVVTAQMAHDLE